MRTQNHNAIQERIRQVKLELARLRMLERLARLDQSLRKPVGKGKQAWDMTKEAQANIAKGNETIGRVLRERASVPAAMTHPELGAITFDWGEPGDPTKDYEGGWGLSHVLARHGETVVREIPKVIASGKITRQYGPPNGQRVVISDGTHTAVLSLHRFGKRETWLLTSWKEKGPDEPGSDSALSGPTPFGPTLNRPEGGAGPTSIIGATGPEVKPADPPPVIPGKAAPGEKIPPATVQEPHAQRASATSCNNGQHRGPGSDFRESGGNSLQRPEKPGIRRVETAQAPLAQLDRASVYGTEG